MASAYPTAAEDTPLGASSGARPVSPSHSTGTLAPGEGWDNESFDDESGRAAPVIQDAFMGTSTSHGTSLYPELSEVQLNPRARRTDATAPHIWFPEAQEQSVIPRWDPADTGGEKATPRRVGLLPPPTPTLDTMSWQIPPRTKPTTSHRMFKLKVHTTRFENHIPDGERPFVVNPANRRLTNQKGLAQAIQQGAGAEYAAWCTQMVNARPDRMLEDGEVVVCGPYLLSQRGYQGIANVAMQNITLGTSTETQTNVLIRYYNNLFRQAYDLQMNSLVMSLFGVGQWSYDPITSIWCFLDAFQGLPDDRLEITLLIPDVRMANTVRRAQMEAWPRDQRRGWGETFEIPPPRGIVEELTTRLQNLEFRQNQTWPRLSEAIEAERRARNPHPETQHGSTWPPAGSEGQGQRQGSDALGARPRSPAPAQAAFVANSIQPGSNQQPTENPRGQDSEERALPPISSLIRPPQDPVGTPRGLPAPVPLYPGGIKLQAHAQENEGPRRMPPLHERHIPNDPSRGFVPIQTPRPATAFSVPMATSTPRYGAVTQSQNTSLVPAADNSVELLDQSTPQESLSEGPQTMTTGAHDTPIDIIVSDQDIWEHPSRDAWSLLTFTNPSLTKSARWEASLARKGGLAYRDLRRVIMNTRSEIGLCPGKPVLTQCHDIFSPVTKVVHMALRKTTLDGNVLLGSEKYKLIKDIRSLIQDSSLFEGDGSAGRPYRMVINMKWGRFKVQGLKKIWMWDAIVSALTSIEDPDHMVIYLMVDSGDLGTVNAIVQRAREENEDLDEESGPHTSSGQISRRDSASSGPSSRGPSHNAQSKLLSSNQGAGQHDLSERGRSTTRRRAAVQFDSSGSRSQSATRRGILKTSSSQPDEEEDDEESGSNWEPEYAGRGPPQGACMVRRAPSRASSTSQSRSRSHSRSRERPAYPRGDPPRAKNKRAKAIKLRPLRAEPPLKGKSFRTSSGLEWGSGISDISDDSEGELAGIESGQMITGYPADWETARALARSPSAERVLAQPGLSGPYKDAYLQAGYDLLRDQVLERDIAMARAARAQSYRDTPVMRGNYPSSYNARQESELPSRLAPNPVGSSTPYSAPLSFLYPNGSLFHATGYPSGAESHAHALLSKAQLIKQLAPEKNSGESQANYLRRTAQIFEGSELYRDPDAARVLGHVKGLEVPAGASLESLVALDVRTPGVDPGEKLVEELAPLVSDGKLALAVAAEKITRSAPVSQSILLLEKLFSKVPAGFTLAVGCAHWTQDQLRTECIKYDQIRQLTILKRGKGSQTGSGQPKQPKQQDKPEKDPPKKSQPKPKREARDSKNEERGVSQERDSKEDPPKRAQKQTKKGAPRGPKYLSAEEWAALSPEEKEKMRAQREAAKAAREAQE